jgi:hypothetical protein
LSVELILRFPSYKAFRGVRDDDDESYGNQHLSAGNGTFAAGKLPRALIDSAYDRIHDAKNGV